MKGAILEESNMAGVNLRVATLKHANLQNCILRGAVLAGADLEVRDQVLGYYEIFPRE
jgi:BTB/POZ domain-containing protein KCTD9